MKRFLIIFFVMIICLGCVPMNNFACKDFEVDRCYIRSSGNPFTKDKICITKIQDGYILYDEHFNFGIVRGLSQKCKLFTYKKVN